MQWQLIFVALIAAVLIWFVAYGNDKMDQTECQEEVKVEVKVDSSEGKF